jgi:hypothetical protein
MDTVAVLSEYVERRSGAPGDVGQLRIAFGVTAEVCAVLRPFSFVVLSIGCAFVIARSWLRPRTKSQAILRFPPSMPPYWPRSQIRHCLLSLFPLFSNIYPSEYGVYSSMGDWRFRTQLNPCVLRVPGRSSHLCV